MAAAVSSSSSNPGEDAASPSSADNGLPQAFSLDSEPRAGQIVKDGEEDFLTVQEGLAYILVPPNAPKAADPKDIASGKAQSQTVFYNEIMQYNRDLSVLAIRAFGEDLVEMKRARRERERKNEKSKQQKRIQRKRKAGAGNGTAEAELNTTSESVKGKPEEPAIEVREAQPERWLPSFTILDALSATGLRALRYCHELPFVTSVTANDMSPKATKDIARNIKHNRLTDKIKAVTGDARAHMYSLTGPEFPGSQKGKYDVIDLDPYGTAAPFLDASLQALNDGGLLCVTCTDTAVTSSIGYPEKTFSLYGGLPFKGFPCHEGGLRLLLNAISTSAGRYGIAVEPLLSLSIDYYMRVFVRIRKSPADVKFLAGKTMVVYNCDSGCGAWQTQYLARHTLQEGKKGSQFFKHTFAQAPSASPLCEHCGFKTHLAGPMYGGPIHNPAFVQKVLDLLTSLDKKTYPTMDRLEGMLQTALDETELYEPAPPEKQSKDDSTTSKAGYSKNNFVQLDHHPFYFSPSIVAKVVHCSAPSEAQIRGALRHAGFVATRSHAVRGSIKTNAPWKAIWHIMREWVRQKAPIKEGAVKEGMKGWKIMQKMSADEQDEASPKFEVVFDEQLGRDFDAGGKKLRRYQLNPRENWGPMARAK
ncbi:TRM-domain-containing protein [Aulographum hederae CBS 113979]|uniref:tRNA (guanine(26)-N(2))-dimethyltransferase n=1 Tax=Aulographum hederae CBS 113979 TaxID=1176131 RepID=A0A6G1GRW4_9PEZI|nr:TRM-domain-containing protein [Aulographum hederae CBS 113979]